MAGNSKEWVAVVRTQLCLLEDELLIFAARRHGPGWARGCEEHYGANYRRVSGDSELMRKWALYHRANGERVTLLEEFLGAAPRPLSDAERALLSAEVAAWISYWEVTGVHRGKTVLVRDLLTGEERTVSDKRASRTLLPGQAIAARVISLTSGALFSGVYPVALSAREPMVQVLVNQGQAHYARRSDGRVVPAQLRANTEPLGILNCWRMLNGLLKADVRPPTAAEGYH